MKKILTIITIFTFGVTLSACDGELSDILDDSGDIVPDDVITIGEGNWDSNAFHDQVVKIIIEEGYGINVDIAPADTAVMVSGLKSKDVNLTMELWSQNVETYVDDIANGEYVEVGTNFDDNKQGLYIPAYLQEEYPGLQTVQDLEDYADLFPDPEGGDKSIIYGGPEGWGATSFIYKKLEAYELDGLYKFKTIDSTDTLNATLASAYANEEPWVGYNWEPTWVIGLYDMVLLEDTEYSAEDYSNGIGAFSTVDVNICVDNDFESMYPDVFAFLQNYETSSALTSQALAYMQEHSAEADETAVWFLLENENLWKEWVTQEAYQNIMDYINEQ